MLEAGETGSDFGPPLPATVKKLLDRKELLPVAADAMTKLRAEPAMVRLGE